MVFRQVHTAAPTVAGTANRPSLSFPVLVFHQQGGIYVSTSPPLWVTSSSVMTQMSVAMMTFESSVEFGVYVNGSLVQSFELNSSFAGPAPISSPVLTAYTDLVTIQTTSPGTGNFDMVVYLETAASS